MFTHAKKDLGQALTILAGGTPGAWETPLVDGIMPPGPETQTADEQVLDEIDWISGGVFSAYGYNIGIRANEARALQVLRDHVPGWIQPSSDDAVDAVFSFIKDGTDRDGSRTNLLYRDDIRVAQGPDTAPEANRLGELMELAVAERAKNRVFIHAASVSWRGMGIVLPGISYSGKSTITAELLKLGAEYCADEYTVLDERGNIESLQRPLHLREPDRVKQKAVDPAKFKARTAIGPIPVRLVVFFNYEASATVNLRPLTPGEGLLRLMENTFTSRSQPEKVMAYLDSMVRQSQIYESLRGEAGDAARSIVQRLDETMNS